MPEWLSPGRLIGGAVFAFTVICAIAVNLAYGR